MVIEAREAFGSSIFSEILSLPAGSSGWPEMMPFLIMEKSASMRGKEDKKKLGYVCAKAFV